MTWDFRIINFFFFFFFFGGGGGDFIFFWSQQWVLVDSYDFQIQCGPIITRSYFTQILTQDTQ